jgi:hypothetical protein
MSSVIICKLIFDYVTKKFQYVRQIKTWDTYCYIIFTRNNIFSYIVELSFKI